MNTTDLPDYFKPAATPLAQLLRRVKGNSRRLTIENHCQTGDLDSMPPEWTQHDISEDLKQILAREGPSYRGGEDLPNLLDGQVEVARITLVNSVHGEVISLRASRPPSGKKILLALVDEYQTEFTLPVSTVTSPMTAKQVLDLLQATRPSPLKSSCRLRLDSDFYADLDALADKAGVKQLDGVD